MKRETRVWARVVRPPALLLLIAVVVLAGCGASEDGSTTGGSAGTAASTDAQASGASTDAQASGDPIKIGIIANQSGSVKTLGDQMIRASKAAAEVFGPIDGRPVQFVVGDGGGFNAATTAANVVKLKTQDNVVGMLGMAAAECSGAVSVADRVQIPMIGNSCTVQDVVADKCNAWFINGGLSPASIAEAMAVSAKKQFPDLIGSKWVVIGDDPGWSKSVAEYWEKVPGAQTAGVEIAPFGTVDWAPYIAKLKASGAKAVLIAISWGSQYAAFLQQAKAAGLTDQMQLVAPLGFPENGMIPGYGVEASDDTLAGLLQVKILSQYGAPWTWLEDNPLGAKIVDQFYKDNNYPPPVQANVQAMNTWMMLTAIKEVGTDPDKLIDKLRTGSFESVWGGPDLTVQKDGSQLMVPAYGTKLEKLSEPQFGVDYAQKVLFTMEPSQVTPASGADYGCQLD